MRKEIVKINLKQIKREAIEEYTEIVKTITTLENKHSGSTGFLSALEDSIKEILLDFILGKDMD